MMVTGYWLLVIGRWKFYFLVSCVLCLLSIFSFGQVNTEIDTTRIKIGEPIQYTLSVLADSKDKILLPQLQDTMSFHIEILEQKIDTIFLDDKKKKLVQRLSITSFDPGEFLIRSFPVVVNGDTLLSASFQIKVDDVEIDSANLGGFPIKPIMDEEYTWKDYWDKYWIYVLAGALVFTILLIVLILFLRDKKRKNESSYIVKTPYEEAMESLKNIDNKKYLQKGHIYPFYSELSFILRRYVGRVYNFSSLELLSDDLVNYFRRTTHLDKNDLEKLKEFLYDSDLVKFAKSEPNEHTHALYRKWVEEMIEKIKPLELEDETAPEIKPDEKFRKLK